MKKIELLLSLSQAIIFDFVLKRVIFFLSPILVVFGIQECFLTVLCGHQEGRKDTTLFPSGVIYDFICK